MSTQEESKSSDSSKLSPEYLAEFKAAGLLREMATILEEIPGKTGLSNSSREAILKLIKKGGKACIRRMDRVDGDATGPEKEEPSQPPYDYSRLIRHGKTTNTEKVDILMNYSRAGMMIQLFVLNALRNEAHRVLEDKDELLESGLGGFISADKWIVCAEDTLSALTPAVDLTPGAKSTPTPKSDES